MMDVMRKTWKDLIPMRGHYGGRAAVLFRCVHALMSHHLEGLITRSLTYLYKTLCDYMVSRNFLFKLVSSFTADDYGKYTPVITLKACCSWKCLLKCLWFLLLFRNF